MKTVDDYYRFPVLRMHPQYIGKLLSGEKRWDLRRHSLPGKTMLIVDTETGRAAGLVWFSGFVHTSTASATYRIIRKMYSGRLCVTEKQAVEGKWTWGYLVGGAAGIEDGVVEIAELPGRSGADATITLPQGTAPFFAALATARP